MTRILANLGNAGALAVISYFTESCDVVLLSGFFLACNHRRLRGLRNRPRCWFLAGHIEGAARGVVIAILFKHWKLANGRRLHRLYRLKFRLL